MEKTVVKIDGKDFNQYVIAELDVWGNARDGFNVNDCCDIGILDLPVGFTDRDVILALKREGYLERNIHHKSISIEGDNDNDEILYFNDARTGEPLYELRVLFNNDTEGSIVEKTVVKSAGKKFYEWEIVSLDVWGNAREGFDVNAAYRTGHYITLPKEYDEREVILALKRAGFLNRNLHHKSLNVEWHETLLTVEYYRTGEPLCNLELNDDTEVTP